MPTLKDKLAGYVKNNTFTVKCRGHDAPMIIACQHCLSLHPCGDKYGGQMLILPYSANGLVGCEDCHLAMPDNDIIKPIPTCVDCVGDMVRQARARDIPVFYQTKRGLCKPLVEEDPADETVGHDAPSYRVLGRAHAGNDTVYEAPENISLVRPDDLPYFDRTKLNLVRPGDHVKVCLDDKERMWIEIVDCCDPERWTGLLKNIPVILLELSRGDLLEFGTKDVIDVKLGQRGAS